jgi:alpha-ketoglutarate-dependent taurine dioxygenase
MDLSTSITPDRVTDPSAVWDLLQKDGAAILEAPDLSLEGTSNASRAVMGEHLLGIGETIQVTSFPDPRRPTGLAPSQPLVAHVDGYSFGLVAPDYIVLHCTHAASDGGDSFLLDTHKMLDLLDSDPEQADLAEFLRNVEIDHSEPGMRPDTGPIMRRTPQGRTNIRYHTFMRPLATSPEAAQHQLMIDRWRALVKAESAKAFRFRLQPGDAVYIDNYRVMHGRDPFTDTVRLLHRCWMWSGDSFGLPDGILGSYAGSSVLTMA